MQEFDFHKASQLIDSASRILIVTHFNPDGDAIGSSLAFLHFMNAMGKDAVVVVPNDYPLFLKWLPGNERIINYQRKRKEANASINEADLIFCLDFNSLHRTGDMAEPIREAKALKILIDHHLEPVYEEFSMHFSSLDTSSTSELVYRFIEGLGQLERMSRPIAEGLFVGIMTDTGSFSYACNLPATFSIASRLVEAGVNAERTHRLVYDTYSENRLRLLGYCLSKKLTVVPDLNLAYITLSTRELNRFKYQVGDTEGVVNYALSIEGVKVAALLTERKDRIRISFRSKGNLSVNRIAREHFNGGGHMNAAGGDVFDTLDASVKKLIEVMSQYKDEIVRSSI